MPIPGRRGRVFNTKDVPIGARVSLRGSLTREGTVRYCGPTHLASGVWAGVALDTPDGRHDGCVDGVRYFVCEEGHGLIVRPSALTRLRENEFGLFSSPRREGRSPSPSSPWTPQSTSRSERAKALWTSPPSGKLGSPVHWSRAKHTNLGLGSRVRARGKYGEVKFIGRVHYASGVHVGVLLDKPSRTLPTCDGSVEGKFYFLCAPDRGLILPSSTVELTELIVLCNQAYAVMDRIANEMNVEEAARPPAMQEVGFASSERLEALRKMVWRLDTERRSREAKVFQWTEDVIELWSALGQGPESEFEQAIEQRCVRIDRRSVQALYDVRKTLIEINEVVRVVAGLCADIQTLWEELGTGPQSELEERVVAMDIDADEDTARSLADVKGRLMRDLNRRTEVALLAGELREHWTLSGHEPRSELEAAVMEGSVANADEELDALRALHSEVVVAAEVARACERIRELWEELGRGPVTETEKMVWRGELPLTREGMQKAHFLEAAVVDEAHDARKREAEAARLLAEEQARAARITEEMREVARLRALDEARTLEAALRGEEDAVIVAGVHGQGDAYKMLSAWIPALLSRTERFVEAEEWHTCTEQRLKTVGETTRDAIKLVLQCIVDKMGEHPDLVPELEKIMVAMAVASRQFLGGLIDGRWVQDSAAALTEALGETMDCLASVDANSEGSTSSRGGERTAVLHGSPAGEGAHEVTGGDQFDVSSDDDEFNVPAQDEDVHEDKDEFYVPTEDNDECGVPAEDKDEFGVPTEGKDEFGVLGNDDGFAVPEDHDEFAVPAEENEECAVPTEDNDGFAAPVEEQVGPGVPEDNDGFGVPAEDNDGFGVPAEDNDGFGVPAEDEDEFAVAEDNDDGFGVPSEDNDGFGVPSEDNDGFGVPSEDNDGFGVPAEGKDGFAVAEDNDGFGVPAEDTDEFGVPAEDKDGFGVPAKGKDGPLEVQLVGGAMPMADSADTTTSMSSSPMVAMIQVITDMLNGRADALENQAQFFAWQDQFAEGVDLLVDTMTERGLSVSDARGKHALDVLCERVGAAGQEALVAGPVDLRPLQGMLSDLLGLHKLLLSTSVVTTSSDTASEEQLGDEFLEAPEWVVCLADVEAAANAMVIAEEWPDDAEFQKLSTAVGNIVDGLGASPALSDAFTEALSDRSSGSTAVATGQALLAAVTRTRETFGMVQVEFDDDDDAESEREKMEAPGEGKNLQDAQKALSALGSSGTRSRVFNGLSQSGVASVLYGKGASDRSTATASRSATSLTELEEIQWVEVINFLLELLAAWSPGHVPPNFNEDFREGVYILIESIADAEQKGVGGPNATSKRVLERLESTTSRFLQKPEQPKGDIVALLLMCLARRAVNKPMTANIPDWNDITEFVVDCAESMKTKEKFDEQLSDFQQSTEFLCESLTTGAENAPADEAEILRALTTSIRTSASFIPSGSVESIDDFLGLIGDATHLFDTSVPSVSKEPMAVSLTLDVHELQMTPGDTPDFPAVAAEIPATMAEASSIEFLKFSLNELALPRDDSEQLRAVVMEGAVLLQHLGKDPSRAGMGAAGALAYEAAVLGHEGGAKLHQKISQGNDAMDSLILEMSVYTCDVIAVLGEGLLGMLMSNVRDRRILPIFCDDIFEVCGVLASMSRTDPRLASAAGTLKRTASSLESAVNSNDERVARLLDTMRGTLAELVRSCALSWVAIDREGGPKRAPFARAVAARAGHAVVDAITKEDVRHHAAFFAEASHIAVHLHSAYPWGSFKKRSNACRVAEACAAFAELLGDVTGGSVHAGVVIDDDLWDAAHRILDALSSWASWDGEPDVPPFNFANILGAAKIVFKSVATASVVEIASIAEKIELAKKALRSQPSLLRTREPVEFELSDEELVGSWDINFIEELGDSVVLPHKSTDWGSEEWGNLAQMLCVTAERITSGLSDSASFKEWKSLRVGAENLVTSLSGRASIEKTKHLALAWESVRERLAAIFKQDEEAWDRQQLLSNVSQVVEILSGLRELAKQPQKQSGSKHTPGGAPAPSPKRPARSSTLGIAAPEASKKSPLGKDPESPPPPLSAPVPVTPSMFVTPATLRTLDMSPLPDISPHWGAKQLYNHPGVALHTSQDTAPFFTASSISTVVSGSASSGSHYGSRRTSWLSLVEALQALLRKSLRSAQDFNDFREDLQEGLILLHCSLHDTAMPLVEDDVKKSCGDVAADIRDYWTQVCASTEDHPVPLLEALAEALLQCEDLHASIDVKAQPLYQLAEEWRELATHVNDLINKVLAMSTLHHADKIADTFSQHCVMLCIYVRDAGDRARPADSAAVLRLVAILIETSRTLVDSLRVNDIDSSKAALLPLQTVVLGLLDLSVPPADAQTPEAAHADASPSGKEDEDEEEKEEDEDEGTKRLHVIMEGSDTSSPRGMPLEDYFKQEPASCETIKMWESSSTVPGKERSLLSVTAMLEDVLEASDGGSHKSLGSLLGIHLNDIALDPDVDTHSMFEWSATLYASSKSYTSPVVTVPWLPATTFLANTESYGETSDLDAIFEATDELAEDMSKTAETLSQDAQFGLHASVLLSSAARLRRTMLDFKTSVEAQRGNPAALLESAHRLVISVSENNLFRSATSTVNPDDNFSETAQHELARVAQHVARILRSLDPLSASVTTPREDLELLVADMRDDDHPLHCVMANAGSLLNTLVASSRTAKSRMALFGFLRHLIARLEPDQHTEEFSADQLRELLLLIAPILAPLQHLSDESVPLRAHPSLLRKITPILEALVARMRSFGDEPAAALVEVLHGMLRDGDEQATRRHARELAAHVKELTAPLIATTAPAPSSTARLSARSLRSNRSYSVDLSASGEYHTMTAVAKDLLPLVSDIILSIEELKRKERPMADVHEGVELLLLNLQAMESSCGKAIQGDLHILVASLQSLHARDLVESLTDLTEFLLALKQKRDWCLFEPSLPIRDLCELAAIVYLEAEAVEEEASGSGGTCSMDDLLSGCHVLSMSLEQKRTPAITVEIEHIARSLDWFVDDVENSSLGDTAAAVANLKTFLARFVESYESNDAAGMQSSPFSYAQSQLSGLEAVMRDVLAACENDDREALARAMSEASAATDRLVAAVEGTGGGADDDEAQPKPARLAGSVQSLLDALEEADLAGTPAAATALMEHVALLALPYTPVGVARLDELAQLLPVLEMQLDETAAAASERDTSALSASTSLTLHGVDVLLECLERSLLEESATDVQAMLATLSVMRAELESAPAGAVPSATRQLQHYLAVMQQHLVAVGVIPEWEDLAPLVSSLIDQLHDLADMGSTATTAAAVAARGEAALGLEILIDSLHERTSDNVALIIEALQRLRARVEKGNDVGGAAAATAAYLVSLERYQAGEHALPPASDEQTGAPAASALRPSNVVILHWDDVSELIQLLLSHTDSMQSGQVPAEEIPAATAQTVEGIDILIDSINIGRTSSDEDDVVASLHTLKDHLQRAEAGALAGACGALARYLRALHEAHEAHEQHSAMVEHMIIENDDATVDGVSEVDMEEEEAAEPPDTPLANWSQVEPLARTLMGQMMDLQLLCRRGVGGKLAVQDSIQSSTEGFLLLEDMLAEGSAGIPNSGSLLSLGRSLSTLILSLSELDASEIAEATGVVNSALQDLMALQYRAVQHATDNPKKEEAAVHTSMETAGDLAMRLAQDVEEALPHLRTSATPLPDSLCEGIQILLETVDEMHAWGSRQLEEAVATLRRTFEGDTSTIDRAQDLLKALNDVAVQLLDPTWTLRQELEPLFQFLGPLLSEAVDARSGCLTLPSDLEAELTEGLSLLVQSLQESSGMSDSQWEVVTVLLQGLAMPSTPSPANMRSLRSKVMALTSVVCNPQEWETPADSTVLLMKSVSLQLRLLAEGIPVDAADLTESVQVLSMAEETSPLPGLLRSVLAAPPHELPLLAIDLADTVDEALHTVQ